MEKIQRVLDLCSGIGGFTLAHLISGGFETVAFCERDYYCQQVLKLRFPNIPIINDVRDITTESISNYGLSNIDGITAGFPCQPFSQAGERKGAYDERALWGEIYRIVCLLRPKWCVFENVYGIITIDDGNYFRSILWQLSQAGFTVEWYVLSAKSVGAIHRRERVWIIAYSNGIRQNRKFSEEKKENISRSGEKTRTLQKITIGSNKLTNATISTTRPKHQFCRSDDGVSSELDGYLLRQRDYKEWIKASTVPSLHRIVNTRIKNFVQDSFEEVDNIIQRSNKIRKMQQSRMTALGNAIVPQVAAKIFDRLKEILMNNS